MQGATVRLLYQMYLKRVEGCFIIESLKHEQRKIGMKLTADNFSNLLKAIAQHGTLDDDACVTSNPHIQKQRELKKVNI